MEVLLVYSRPREQQCVFLYSQRQGDDIIVLLWENRRRYDVYDGMNLFICRPSDDAPDVV
jgi:hypothetical protein